MATTAGYQTIGGDGSTAAKQPPTDAGAIVQEKLGAVARGAGEAATGAREAVAELITAPMPEVNIYTEPLQPAAQLTLRDRVALVLQSCRDWTEFADVRQFNLPHPSEAKLRFGYNLETFFYNYIVIAFVYFVIEALFNIGAALQIVLLLAIATYFYAVHPDPFVFANGNVRIDTNIKHGILITLTALVVVFGKSVFGFVLGGAIFMAFIVGIHALLRKHPVPTSEI